MIGVTSKVGRALFWPLLHVIICWGEKGDFPDFLWVKDVCVAWRTWNFLAVTIWKQCVSEPVRFTDIFNVSDDSSRTASMQSRVGSKQRPFWRMVLLPLPRIITQRPRRRMKQSLAMLLSKFQPQNNLTAIRRFTKVFWSLKTKYNIYKILGGAGCSRCKQQLIQVSVLQPDWVTGTRKNLPAVHFNLRLIPARCCAAEIQMKG